MIKTFVQMSHFIIIVCIAVAALLTARVKPKKYFITTYGAVADASTLNTKAIQKTIDACAAEGVVVHYFPNKKGLPVTSWIPEQDNLYKR
jgi:hypothetical protein